VTSGAGGSSTSGGAGGGAGAVEVDTTFDITIEGNEADSLNRVGNGLDLIERKMARKRRRWRNFARVHGPRFTGKAN